MVETLLERPAEWLSGKGPDADLALFSRCRLERNLADYHFPGRCTVTEKKAIEERIISVLDSLNFTSTGRYWSLEDLSSTEVRLLAERRLMPESMLKLGGPRGVYIAEDQSFSIVVNGQNHVSLRSLASGGQIQEAWARVNLTDDTLGGLLDYAFHERLGYLTAALAEVGTGLKAAIVLHLPGLTMAGDVPRIGAELAEQRHDFKPLFPSRNEAIGDLYLLENACTLGRSEEETLFHLKHLAADLIARERDARARIAAEAPMQLEDRVGRALGTARGARLLALDEALSVLSSLRLGASQGMLEQFSVPRLNEAFLVCQNAHIEMKRGHECDELTLNIERADLFRARFA